MQKNNYFDSLEELAVLCTRSVFLASSSTRPAIHRASLEMQELQSHALELLCSVEETLFFDFLPPLERQSIAEIAHSLCRIIEASARLLHQKSAKPSAEKRIKGAEVCSALSSIIEDSVKMLKRIKKPSTIPELRKFRELLLSSRRLSRTAQKKQSFGLSLVCELREELSDCFDKIVEAMLRNI